MTPRLEFLISELYPVLREEMLKVAVPNCCIATVAVLRRVLKCHGFGSRALPVSVIIRNAKMLKCLAAGMVVPSDPELLQAWMKATGSWCIGIVPESAVQSALRGYKAFGGHVICHVQDTLIDAALCQANRPEHGIELPALISMPALGRFMKGEGALVGEIKGCEVEYRPLKDPSWRQAPDWTDERRYREAVNAILKRVRL